MPKVSIATVHPARGAGRGPNRSAHAAAKGWGWQGGLEAGGICGGGGWKVGRFGG